MTQVTFSNETVGGGSVGALTPVKTPRIPNYKQKLKEAAELVGKAMKGNPYAVLKLKEAFSTSDFPFLFGDILSRELLPQYQEAPSVWAEFARRTVVRDFRPHNLIDLLGGQDVLSLVPELTEYPARDLGEAEYSLTVAKHGARFAISWESQINDDLGGLQGLPGRLAVAARRTEDRLATTALTDGDGPNDAFFNVGNGNAPTELPLTIDNLSTAIEAITSRVDEDGAPIWIDGFVLVVPPSLEVAARNILGATEIRITQGTNVMITNNWLASRITLSVNPWLTVVDQGEDAGTTWYVLPNPNAPRPAVALGFLRGNETPDLRLRSSDSERPGGGAVPAEEGGFDNDDVQYRVRHVLGMTTVDPIATYASFGAPQA